MGNGRPGAEADALAVGDELGGCLGSGALVALDGVAIDAAGVGGMRRGGQEPAVLRGAARA